MWFDLRLKEEPPRFMLGSWDSGKGVTLESSYISERGAWT